MIEELLSLIIQVLLESFLYWPSDRYLIKKTKFRSSENQSPNPYLFLIAAGSIVGFISTFIFSHYWITSSFLKVINLILAPILAGWIAEKMKSKSSLPEKSHSPQKHFWRAFSFTLGLVCARYYFLR